MTAALLMITVVTQAVGAPAARSEALDLDTALALAAKNDERPAIARAQAAQARAQYKVAWARLLPNISVSGTYRRRAFEIIREFDGNTATLQASNALAAEGRVDMRLLDPSVIPEIQAADLTADARQEQAEEQARRLAFETAEAFYAALAADRTLDAAERRLALAATTSSDALARFEAGLVAQSEINRTRLDEAEARQARAEAVRARRLARIALGFLIGVEPRGALEVPPRPAAIADRAAYMRPDVAAARLLVDAAQRAAWAPWLSMLPTIDLAASLRANNETGFQDNVFNWDVALIATWVLYDGGERYGRAAEREAQAESARQTLAALERTADVEVARASSDLEASLEILEQARSRAALAEDNRNEVTARFSQGLASALEVADAATSAFAAKVALEQARFEVAQAALAVRSAVGAWPTSEQKPG